MKKYKVMLAKQADKDILRKKGFIYEPKLDGTRVLIYKNHTIKLINRRDHNVTRRYPELNIKDNIKSKTCVLDAELVILNNGKPDFNLLQTREQLDKPFTIKLRSEQFPATLFVFDILEKDGKDLTSLPLIKRKKILRKTIIDSPFIVFCPYTKNGLELWHKVKQLGMEGVMAKRVNSLYEGTRSKSWLKIKNLNTVDAIIIGFTKGKGLRSKVFGSLVLASYINNKLTYIGRVGTGFDTQMINKLSKMLKKLKTEKCPLGKKELESHNVNVNDIVWVKPKLIAEVKYLKLTKQHELRAPSFLRLRFDKKLKDCVI